MPTCPQYGPGAVSCGILWMLITTASTLGSVSCPHGRFQVAVNQAQYQANQNVQIILLKTDESEVDEARHFRVCVGCRDCYCQNVSWSREILALGRDPAKDKFVHWFQSLHNSSVRYLRPLVLGLAHSYTSSATERNTTSISQFFIEQQSYLCVEGNFSFSVSRIHPDRRAVLLSEGDSFPQTMTVFPESQTFFEKATTWTHHQDGIYHSRKEYTVIDEEAPASIDVYLHLQNGTKKKETLTYPRLSTETAFCNALLRFCKKHLMQTRDCFRMMETIKKKKQPSSFLPYRVSYESSVIQLKILYVILSYLPDNRNIDSCFAPTRYGSDSIVVRGLTASRLFPAITQAARERSCCWDWMVIIDCKTKFNENIVLKHLQDFDSSHPFYISRNVDSATPQLQKGKKCFGRPRTLTHKNDVDFGLVSNGIALSRAAVDIIVPRFIESEAIPFKYRNYLFSKSWCMPYTANEIRLANCLYDEFGWSMTKIDLFNKGGESRPKTKKSQSCKEPIHSIIHGTVSYEDGINSTVAWFRAISVNNASCKVKHLLVWDSEGIRPNGVPDDIDLDVIPHPRGIVPDLMMAYRFAQVKYFALLMEIAKRMDENERITHCVLTDTDSFINLPIAEEILRRYMPHGSLFIGGDHVDQAIEGGYVGSGFSFYTRDLVFAIRAYSVSHFGNFPGNFIYSIDDHVSSTQKNPLENFDVAISSLTRSLGGTIVQLPGAYHQNAYCELPRGYLHWPILATQGAFTKKTPWLPQHDEVLGFMLGAEDYDYTKNSNKQQMQSTSEL